MSIATDQRRVGSVSMNDLREFLRCEATGTCEHERDAALGAFAAWAMLTKREGWKNLLSDESDAFVPVPPIEYWMPCNVAEQRLPADAPQATRR
jgi:hypothetical protein